MKRYVKSNYAYDMGWKLTQADVQDYGVEVEFYEKHDAKWSGYAEVEIYSDNQAITVIHMRVNRDNGDLMGGDDLRIPELLPQAKLYSKMNELYLDCIDYGMRHGR